MFELYDLLKESKMLRLDTLSDLPNVIMFAMNRCELV